MAGRFQLGFTTERPFAEHLVWFWTNHFTVSTTAGRTLNFAGAFEREAIRPYIAGKFEDMLLAVASHPAMLVYLNNVASIGPDSPAGMRTGKGRNENLGRELMELYSLGVDGGYTQADVIALANILTGWGLDPNAPSGFGFFPNRHEPGHATPSRQNYAPDLKAASRRCAIWRMIRTPPVTSPSNSPPISSPTGLRRNRWRGWKRCSTTPAAICMRWRRRRWKIPPPGRRRPPRCARRWNM